MVYGAETLHASRLVFGAKRLKIVAPKRVINLRHYKKELAHIFAKNGV